MLVFFTLFNFCVLMFVIFLLRRQQEISEIHTKLIRMLQKINKLEAKNNDYRDKEIALTMEKLNAIKAENNKKNGGYGTKICP